jgi:DNA-directed RNA polymerase specialized sigma24 family protein
MTFEELYDELYHPLLRQALHQRVPYHDAEDVVHDAFISYLRFRKRSPRLRST